MFQKKADGADPMYALLDRLADRDVEAAYRFLRLFKTRPDLDPVMHDLMRAVALVAADMIGEDDE
jgi:hypothetical protein